MLIANFKQNGSYHSLKVWVQTVCENLKHNLNFKEQDACNHIGIAPPAIYCDFVAKLSNHKLAVGIQNISQTLAGAYTGEIGVDMCNDLKLKFCLIGHSERRFGNINESNEAIELKLEQALNNGITPVLCIGEPLDERTNGTEENWLARQIDAAFNNINWDKFPNAKVVIAYEPIWAIGTGMVATEQQIEKTMMFLRRHITSLTPGLNFSTIYGGSVNVGNFGKILSVSGVQGALVGSASLDSVAFNKLVNLYIQAKST